MARNNAEALEKMAEASTLADMIELRLDVMDKFDLKEIVESATNPILITYRSKGEGGGRICRIMKPGCTIYQTPWRPERIT